MWRGQGHVTHILNLGPPIPGTDKARNFKFSKFLSVVGWYFKGRGQGHMTLYINLVLLSLQLVKPWRLLNPRIRPISASVTPLFRSRLKNYFQQILITEGIYSDATQLNSTSSWVELRRYKRAVRVNDTLNRRRNPIEVVYDEQIGISNLKYVIVCDFYEQETWNFACIVPNVPLKRRAH